MPCPNSDKSTDVDALKTVIPKMANGRENFWKKNGNGIKLGTVNGDKTVAVSLSWLKMTSRSALQKIKTLATERFSSVCTG